MFVFSLLPVALLAMQVAAAAAPRPFTHSSVSKLLSSRQSPTLSSDDIPDQCQSACKGFLDVQSNPTCRTDKVECMCNDAAGKSYVQCESCLANLPEATNSTRSFLQEGLDFLVTDCKSAHHPFNTTLSLSSGALSASPSVAFRVAAWGGVAVLLHIAS